MEVIDFNCDGQLLNVVWISNEEFAYACFTNLGHPMQWTAYDTVTRLERQILSPLNYDHSIWEDFGIEPPLFAEIGGLVSPSGKYALYTVRTGEPFSGSIETWVADTVENRHAMLFETDRPGRSLTEALWFDDETRALLHLSYEGSGRFDVAEIQSGRVTPLAEISEFSGRTWEGMVWSMSDTAETLAIAYDTFVSLVSLRDGTFTVLDQVSESPHWRAQTPSWSTEGDVVYYWKQVTGYRREIRAYDLATASTSILVELIPLVPTADNRFAVSPSEDRIVIWGGGLYLITLD